MPGPKLASPGSHHHRQLPPARKPLSRRFVPRAVGGARPAAAGVPMHHSPTPRQLRARRSGKQLPDAPKVGQGIVGGEALRGSWCRWPACRRSATGPHVAGFGFEKQQGLQRDATRLGRSEGFASRTPAAWERHRRAGASRSSRAGVDTHGPPRRPGRGSRHALLRAYETGGRLRALSRAVANEQLVAPPSHSQVGVSRFPVTCQRRREREPRTNLGRRSAFPRFSRRWAVTACRPNINRRSLRSSLETRQVVCTRLLNAG